MFLISDNIDTYTGMRLAGVEGVVVHTHDAVSYTHLDVYKRQVKWIIAIHFTMESL